MRVARMMGDLREHDDKCQVTLEMAVQLLDVSQEKVGHPEGNLAFALMVALL